MKPVFDFLEKRESCSVESSMPLPLPPNWYNVYILDPIRVVVKQVVEPILNTPSGL